ncbi:MAG TPA: hypothetical protein DCE07_06825 [Peptococcaceae bacterium]|nr:hypothetical protein [Peptococcaceae bacterium]
MLKQVSCVVLLKRALLSGLVIYLVVALFDLVWQQLLKKSPQGERAEARKSRNQQVEPDLVSRLTEDPARGAELLQKMGLTREEDN